MSERDILTRVSLLTLVGIAAMWFLLISPKRDDASKQAQRVTTAQQRLLTAGQTLAAGQRAQAQAPENRRILVALGTALPDSAGAAALLRELNGTSNNDNVAFRTASVTGAASSAPAGAGAALLPPGAVLGANGLPTLPLSLTFDGRYLRLTALLDRLRRFVALAGSHVVVHGRLLSVESVQLTRDDPTNPTVSASLAATAYLAPLPGTTPTATGAAPTTPGGTGATSSTATTTTATTASAGATP